MNEETIFERARFIGNPVDRARFLDQICGGNSGLRSDVESLLAAHFAQENPLDQSPATGLYTPASDVDSMGTVGTRVGPFKLLQKLGEGGMGEVWMADQAEPVRRRVAIKLIKVGMDTAQVVARFEAERQALALMEHQNIAKVFDAGTTDTGRPYFVMELVHGIPITKYCDQEQLSPRQRLELFVPVCHAVQHAHQKGIIHRDLKPSNVLIALYDGQPVPKVIDFGVAKATNQQLTEKTMFTEFGQVIGTLEYMSPEQAEMNALDIDTRSDIYSLGVLLYELLTGTTPLDRKKLRNAAFDEMLRLIREEEPPKPSTRLSQSGDALPSISARRKTEPAKLANQLRGDLDWIVMKALEKDRGRRYETANGFARDIQRFLCDEPVEASPPSARYRWRKFIKRNRGAVLAATVIGMMTILGIGVVLGVVGTAWGLLESKRQLRRAESAMADALDQSERANLARDLADRNFQKARAAVENYLQKVTDNQELKTRGDFTDLRKQLLTAAVPFFEEFVKEKSDDPRVRLDQGRAFCRLAQLRTEIGEFPQAEKDFRTAIALIQQSIVERSDNPVCRSDLATALTSLGNLLTKTGNAQEGESVYRQSISISEKLVAQEPATLDHSVRLVRCQNNLGVLLEHQGRYADAERQYNDAIRTLEKLVENHPADLECRRNLGASHLNRGNLLKVMGNRSNSQIHWPEAEKHYRKALVHTERLAADYPKDPNIQQDLGRSLLALANLLCEMEKYDEAEKLIQRSLFVRSHLVEKFPTVLAYRQELTRCHIGLVSLLRSQGRFVEAEVPARQVVAAREKLTLDHPTNVELQIELARSQYGLGWILHDQGKFELSLEWNAKAMASLEKALSVNPNLAYAQNLKIDCHVDRAYSLLELRRYPEVVVEVDKAIAGTNEGRRIQLRMLRACAAVHTQERTAAISETMALVENPILGEYGWAQAAKVLALHALDQNSEAKKDELARKSVILLQKSRMKGYFQLPWRAAGIRNDPDLVALKDRDDFKQFLKDLESASTNKP